MSDPCPYCRAPMHPAMKDRYGACCPDHGDVVEAREERDEALARLAAAEARVGNAQHCLRALCEGLGTAGVEDMIACGGPDTWRAYGASVRYFGDQQREANRALAADARELRRAVVEVVNRARLETPHVGRPYYAINADAFAGLAGIAMKVGADAPAPTKGKETNNGVTDEA